MIQRSVIVIFLLALGLPFPVFAATDGSISGTVATAGGKPLSDAVVELYASNGQLLATTKASSTGDYQFPTVPFGDYEVRSKSPGDGEVRAPVHVNSGANTPVNITFEKKAPGKSGEIVVLGQRRSSVASSVREVGSKDIAVMPQGEDIKLPKLIATITPGVVQGPFGQTFIRGNHANIQYQIDGVQLPDSPSNTFGEAFSPRNIDHMEIITGGIPAEYGERLAAVVNIITKSGEEMPGATASISYGSYNTMTPSLEVSGSSASGSFKYYLSGNYSKTDRGLDTPQPTSETSQQQGGSEAVHDKANNDNEFFKLDWVGTNDRLSLIGFNERGYFQIPTYPKAFLPTAPFFQPGFVDNFGNTGGFNYLPAATDDDQTERNRYTQLVYKHQISGDTFFQLAPYYKGSEIKVRNDPVNDLAAKDLIPGSAPSSFSEDKKTDNYGLKGDLTTRLGPANKVKTGFQYQSSKTSGPLEVISGQGAVAASDGQPATAPMTTTSDDNGVDKGVFEAVYLQDEVTATQWLTLSLGLRYDATQFMFADQKPTDAMLQPRVGISLLLTDSTRLHLFYGKLFQPAPAENLRDTFNTLSGGAQELTPYDIKAEKDDFYEIGIDQGLPGPQVLSLTYWYKLAENMLDDAQLLNTSIAQPYNFKKGFAYGTEVSLAGQFSDRWGDFINYSYEIARGKGISGGLFAFPQGQGAPSDDYVYLDHCQINTGNAGVRYRDGGLWWTLQSTYGSGLRTGPDNSKSLPTHVTEDTTLGYGFLKSQSWLSELKVSGDVLNITDNRYPISVANGFNGSHYSAGREYFLHLSKEI